MMTLPRCGLAAAVLLGWLGEPTTSHACGGSPCLNDQFLPHAGSVPANIQAIAWNPGFDARTDAGVDSPAQAVLPRFECEAADGSSHELRFSALPVDRPDHLALLEPLVAGERCTIISGIADCSADYQPADGLYLAGRAELDVVESASAPGDLGLLAVAGPRRDFVDLAADASCSERVEACLVDVSVVFSAAALPWKDALLFETRVDDEPFSTWRDLVVPDELGGLYHGRDRGVVFVLGGTVPENVRDGYQLEAGEHTIAIRARLPASDQWLSTPPVTVNLDCGRFTEPPLAANEFSGNADSCSVTSALGSSQRRRSTWGVWALLAAIVFAARRRSA